MGKLGTASKTLTGKAGIRTHEVDGGKSGAGARSCAAARFPHGGARGDEGRPGSGSEEDEDPQEKAEPPHDAHEDSGWSSDFSSIPLRLLGFGVLMGWHFLLLFFPLMISNERLLPHDAHEDSGWSSDFSSIPLRLLGFGVLMGWHFLLLFFPLMISNERLLPEYLFQRQLVLNTSLGVFFIVFGWVLERFCPAGRNKTLKLLVCGTLATVAGCTGLVLAAETTPLVFRVVAVSLVGAGEAVLMLLWLRFYSETSVNFSGRYLAASALIGSLLCYFTRNLTSELAVGVFLVLPLLSAVMYLLGRNHVRMRGMDEAGRGVSDWSAARKPFFIRTGQLMVFACVFGMFQGSVVPGGEALLTVADPLSVIGVGVAGAFLAAMYLRTPVKPDLRLLHKASILLFVGGIMLAPFVTSFLATVAAAAALAGFMLLDLISLIFTIDLIRTFDLRSGIIIGLNRGLEYAAFAVGILAGFLMWGAYGISLIFTIDLIRTFDLRSGIIIGLNRGLEYAAFAVGILAGFLMWGAYGALPEFPYAMAFVSVLVSFAAALFLLDVKDVWTADYYAPAPPYVEAEEEQAPEFVRTRGRWRSACDAVCEEYGLSPREREIFPSIAKGRNAEYIQNAFVISGHTAKTHISNIYGGAGSRVRAHARQVAQRMRRGVRGVRPFPARTRDISLHSEGAQRRVHSKRVRHLGAYGEDAYFQHLP